MYKKSWKQIFVVPWNTVWNYLAANGNRGLFVCWQRKRRCGIVKSGMKCKILPMQYWRRH